MLLSTHINYNHSWSRIFLVHHTYIPTCTQLQLGVLPLGTGNDLARVLGWGAAFDDDEHALGEFIDAIEKSKVQVLDRSVARAVDLVHWEVIILNIARLAWNPKVAHSFTLPFMDQFAIHSPMFIHRMQVEYLV